MQNKPKHTLKDIFQSWKRKDPNPMIKQQGKKVFKSKKRMPENIYGSETLGQELNKFNWFHYFFKYKILVPLLKYIDNKIDTKCPETIPKKSWNEQILMFNRAYEQSLKDWCQYYRGGKMSKKGKPLKFNFNKQFKNDYAVQLLGTMRKIAVTGYMTDTAYREFANIFFYRFYLEMDKIHHDKKSITHLLYKSKDTRDVVYFGLFQKIEQMAIPLNAEPNYEKQEQVEIKQTKTKK
jgi:hypothetical protein